jgi:Uma2 family endonuclease
MSAVAEKTQVTPEELLRLPKEKDFELVDGELVERKVSSLSSWVGTTIARLIGNHVETEQLGWVFGADSGCQCFSDLPNTVRKPDVTFVKAARLGEDQIGDGWLRLVPDLIVEVISPNDLAEEVEEKVEMFHRAGVPLVWVVSPTANGSTTTLREDDQLSGEDVIPGFACAMTSIFLPKKPHPPAVVPKV